MKTERKQELKGAFKAIIAIAVLGLMIGIGVATTLMSDEGFFKDGNEVLVEGDYTNWGHKWNTSLPGGIKDTFFTLFQIDEQNDVLSVLYEDDSTYTRFATCNLADCSIIWNSSSGQDYAALDTYPSLSYAGTGDNAYLYNNFATSSRTYLLVVSANSMEMNVWRAGSLVWNHNITTEGFDEIGSGGISKTGKWIVVSVWNSNAERLVCYEGS